MTNAAGSSPNDSAFIGVAQIGGTSEVLVSEEWDVLACKNRCVVEFDLRRTLDGVLSHRIGQQLHREGKAVVVACVCGHNGRKTRAGAVASDDQA